MYTKEQEERALKEYERLGSITAVIRQLGHPSESTEPFPEKRTRKTQQKRNES